MFQLIQNDKGHIELLRLSINLVLCKKSISNNSNKPGKDKSDIAALCYIKSLDLDHTFPGWSHELHTSAKY